MAKGEWQDLTPPERSRTYVYANGETVRYTNVKRIKVSESGNHYLEADDAVLTSNGVDGLVLDGHHAIVAPAWRQIVLNIDGWTF